MSEGRYFLPTKAARFMASSVSCLKERPGWRNVLCIKAGPPALYDRVLPRPGGSAARLEYISMNREAKMLENMNSKEVRLFVLLYFMTRRRALFNRTKSIKTIL